MSPAPGQPPVTIARSVIYRSRTGKYDVPAIVTATVDTLAPDGVKLYEETGGKKGVPPLSSPDHVHLTVLTPGIPGFDVAEAEFQTPRQHGPDKGNINYGGTYQEWDIPMMQPPVEGSGADPLEPGTWRWPERV